jgi:hypothetical protein
MYKEAALLSALMKECTVPYDDTGNVNVMLVLQSCTDCLHILPGSSNQTFRTSSEGTCDINIDVEEDIYVMEESLIATNKQEDTGIKQEDISEDITLPDIKVEQDEVSYVCVCLLLDRFYQCLVCVCV